MLVTAYEWAVGAFRSAVLKSSCWAFRKLLHRKTVLVFDRRTGTALFSGDVIDVKAVWGAPTAILENVLLDTLPVPCVRIRQVPGAKLFLAEVD